MIYTMNGMTTRLGLRADEVGTYQGLSSHFSGDGFPDMMFDVHVVSQTEFSDWATKAATSDQALNADSYRELLKQFVPKDKALYRLTDPELFLGITTQRIAPGPGPEQTAKIGANDAR
jgi:cytochrome o ubiquinol oxidase subunit 2